MSSPHFSLTPPEIHELVDLAGELMIDSERCADAGMWRAALLLVGGAVEAGLIATASRLEPELRGKGIWPSQGDPRQWTLGQAVRLASAAGWLPTTLPSAAGDLFAPLRGDVGDAVSFLVRVRNMVVHPGVYVREEARPDFADTAHMQPTYDILRGIADKVFARLERAIDASRTSQ